MSIKFQCGRCGSEVNLDKEIVVDEHLKKVEIVYPKCSCGNRSPIDFKLLDLTIGDAL